MDPGDFVCSAIETPSVVGLLRNILSQYPDNGQIIKELVQNGEDAGARTIEVLHMKFPFQCQQTCIRRFVKGPALCLFNDAVFSEEDWQGIRMLSGSIKKADPVKIGQFGLGFKSVFHMTDCVTIISGDSVLFMDPSEPESTMCRKTSLKTLTKYVSKSECLALLGNVHLDKEHLISGNFPGTIFWFPLRQKISELSKTIYNEDRVHELFESFGTEMPFSLIFLKSLESVSLFDCESSMKKSLIKQIKLENADIHKLRNQRNEFLRQVHFYHQKKANEKAKTLMYKVELKLTSGSGIQQPSQKLCILHYLPKFLTKGACPDGENVQLPLVGVAASLSETLSGNIFCFLPLPLSSDNCTQLPVQLNAAFILNQNRRHVKWKTRDSRYEADVCWNEKLVAEILPKAYGFLLSTLLKEVQGNLCDKQTFYRLLPDIKATSGRWRELSIAVWQTLLHEPFLFSEAKMKMMRPCDVISTHTLKQEPEDVKEAVLKTLTEFKVPLSTFPESILRSLVMLKVKPKAVTPSLLRAHLRTGVTSVDTKQLLLYFILSDGEYSDLEGVPLLPLENNQWICFSKKSSTVYLCSKKETEALKGLEHMLLSTSITTAVLRMLKEVAESGCAQIREFNVLNHGAQLLKKSTVAVMKNPAIANDLTLWLKQVWCLIQPLSLRNVSDLRIVPTTDHPSVSSLIPLTNPIIVQRQGSQLSKTSSETLKDLHIQVLTMPAYIKHCEISEFLNEGSSHGINSAIVKALRLHGNSKLTRDFNMNCNEEKICSLIDIIDFHSMEMPLHVFFKGLNLFLAVKGNSQVRVSLKECSNIFPKGTKFPIVIPEPLIKIRGPKELEFAKWLGAEEISEVDLCCFVLDQGCSLNEMKQLVQFIMKSLHLSSDGKILERLRNTKFIPNERGTLFKASDLYSPDESLSVALKDEGYFPSSFFIHHLQFLKILGLKSPKDMPKQTVVDIIRSVSVKAVAGSDHSEKVSALLRLVNDHKDCAEICSSVMNTPFVQGSLQPPPGYPSNLPWATAMKMYKPSEIRSLEKFTDIIGCVYPLVACRNVQNVMRNFGWNKEPTADIVVQQLKKFIQNYRGECLQNSNFIVLIKRVYETLTSYCHTPIKSDLKDLQDIECILTDYGFKKPHEVCINSGCNDLKLVPFVYPLHSMFLEQRGLFELLGAYKEQTPAMLVSVLRVVFEAHKSGKRGINESDSDRSLIVSILQRSQLYPGEIKKSELLLPVESADGTLKMEMAEHCTFSDKSSVWLEDDMEDMGVKVVHSCVSSTLAKALGIDPLSKHLFKEQEAIVEWEQKEPLTTRIHDLLRRYRDGLAVLKELVQNADDAGAEKLQFMYDEREGMEARSKLISKNMADFQGPALWAFNDAEFTNEELENITRLGAATKEQEASKIGKFGLGFCSVYNLTDIPSFVTGTSYVIFDPHRKNICDSNNTCGGMKYDLSKKMNKIMFRKLDDQLKPFQDVFGFDIKEECFKGSLFRFPLRTRAQAAASEISSVVYGHSEMVDLLSMFMKTAGNLLLFTQSIKEIEVYHLGPSGSSPKEANILLHVTRNLARRLTFQQDVLKTFDLDYTQMEYASYHLRSEGIFEYNEITFADIRVELGKSAEQLCSLKMNNQTVKWLISWDSGFGEAIRLARKLGQGTLPLAAVAVPVCKTGRCWKPLPLKDLPTGFYKNSHIHCFLPLPIQTGFSLHINGYFQVASDRTSLKAVTEDDRSYSTYSTDWNTCLIKDAVTAAWIGLLSFLRVEGLSENSTYHELWPLRQDARDNLYLEMVESFYAVIVDNNLSVFRQDGKWYALSDCWFLENQFFKESVGKSAFAFLAQCLKHREAILVEMPEEIVEGFMDSSFSDKIISSRTFFLSYFLPNMHFEYITATEKENLMLYVVDRQDVKVLETVMNVDCIPTMPKYKLRRPADLVHPKGLLAQLYNDDDERFPTEPFIARHRIDVLNRLGMLDSKLTLDMIKERVQTVSVQPCSSCAVERTRAIIKYMAHQPQQRNEIARTIKKLEFLPVMKKPEYWPVSWRGSICFEKLCKPCDRHKKNDENIVSTFSLCSPSLACSSKIKELVGGIRIVHQPLADDEFGTLDEVWKALEIPTKSEEVPLELAIEQLKLIISELQTGNHELQEGSLDWCDQVIHNLYSCIDTSVSKGDCMQEILQDKEILHTKDGFKKPSQFALSGDSHCPPNFFSAAVEGLGHYKHFLEAVGVRERFGPEVILKRMQEKGSELKGRKLSMKEVQQFSELLCLLFRELKSSELAISSESILLPDENHYLQYTKDLCIEDGASVSKIQFTLIHPEVALSKDMADTLGILSKSRKMYRHSSYRMKFGQEEALTTRIRNILKDYPCDSGIMKELLQNADDAGATEICFIKDFRNHATEKLIDPGWSALQGPALCIYNNSSFTEEDLESIQNLGESNKIYDPASTGQYGIGFNAVYHLTDAPSFLTKGPKVNSGETLCLFDPHCWYDPDAVHQSPGVRLQKLHDLRVNFPDSFKVYLEESVMNKEGTLFRLPLRQCEDSKISDEIISIQKINNLLTEFIKDMKKCLLFLRSVRKISIASINSNGVLKTEYCVQSSMDDRARPLLDSLSKHIKSYRSFCIGDDMNLYEIPRKRAAYHLHISDSKQNWQNWYIVQQIGANKLDTVPEVVKNAFKDRKLCMLPHGGVAFLMSHQTVEKGLIEKELTRLMSTSCYLPLPVSCNLPFSVNGHFALDTLRRDLRVGEDYRTIWNKWIMKEVIAPVIVQALCFWRSYIFPDPEEKLTHSEYENRISIYYNCFPSVKKIDREKWEVLVTSVYFHIKAERYSLFDVFIPTEDEMPQNTTASFIREINNFHSTEDRSCGTIEWWPLEHEISKFPLYFGLLGEKNEVTGKCIVAMLNSLKRLNMKISSKKAYELVCKAGVEVSIVDPSIVLDFLHSWSEDGHGNCKVKVSVDVKETGFRSILNVCNILTFISKCENFSERVQNLPLLITEDSLLQSFSEGSPVFVSTFSSLLPEMKEKFVHCRMVKCIQKVFGELKSCSVVKNFDLDDLIVHLPQVLDSTLHGKCAVKLDKENKELINWLWKFWVFIGFSYEELTFREIDWDQRKDRILHALGEWSLYPIHSSGSDYIIPINLAKYTLAPTIESKKLFGKLSLPFAFTWRDIYKESGWVLCPIHGSEFAYINPINMAKCTIALKLESETMFDKLSLTLAKLEEFCTNHTEPSCLVELLFFHRKQLLKDTSSKEFARSAKNILRYFNNCITEEGADLDVHKLICLPLYEDVQGNFCSVESTVPIICPGIPKAGLDKIGQAAGFMLLKEEHERIYEFLGSNCKMSAVMFYKEYILPMLEHICQENIIKHMRFLRYMLEYYQDSDLEGLVSVLKKTPFILYNSEYVTADVFTDHNVLVFRMMSSHTLPEPWRDRKWYSFLKVAGMRVKLTPELFMKYAQQLISSKNVLENSKVLVQHLFSNLDDFKSIIDQVSAAEFLVPEIKPSLDSLLPSFKTPSGFTSFKEGIEQKFAEVVWTQASLLPSYAEPPEDMKKILQVNCWPPHNVIVDHVNSFCSSMKEKGVPPDKGFESVMDKIYEQLEKCDDSVIENLKGNSLIHLPVHEVMVAPCFVVEELIIEILPYLYQAPRRYGRFSNILQKLGMQKKATCTTYANILEYIYNDSKGKKLNPEESRKMQIAVEKMITPLCELKTLECSHLFLPCTKGTLVKSTDMYFADIEQTVISEDILDKPLFIELEFLKIDKSSSDFIAHLPKHLKPVLLSTVLDEEFDSDTAVEVNSPLLTKIKTFLASLEFRHGCLRLVNDWKLKNLCNVTFEEEEEVSKIINSLDVIQVQKIKSRYLYKHAEVCIRKLHFFIKNGSESGGKRYLYISQDIPEETVPSTLHKTLKALTKFMDSDNLHLLLATYKSPQKLEAILDHNGIKAYEKKGRPSLYNTTPGTYLDINFIHMLDNAFHTLNREEIVAMKQYLITDGEDDSIFIIVKIHSVVDGHGSSLTKEYEVETGYNACPIVKVKGHQLYRFVRSSDFEEDDLNKKLVPKGEEPETVFSESEVMKMVRKQILEIWKYTDEKERRHLLRRLVLEWYPDKTSDRMELCTRVTQYIHSLVSRLERRETVTEDEPSRTWDSYSTSYEDLFRSPPRYYTGSSRSSKPRSNSQRNEYSENCQAKVWMRQADHDLKEARDREEGGSSCWVVYMCHQASEKAIAAALFLEDRDKAVQFQNGPFNRSLIHLASQLTSHELLLPLCQEMEARIAKHVNMRYPIFGSAPCDVYQRCDAHFMMRKASEVITLIKERFKD